MSEMNTITIREPDGSVVNMEIHSELASVTALAREYAKAGYPDRYVVFSERQNKSSHDDSIESGMHMACILRPSLFPSQASLLGALSATAMATALEEHTTARLGIGWVSDIYCEGIKIGDTSIEGKLDNFTTYEYIIVTFSAKLDADNFPPRLSDMIRKVFEIENTSISMIVARGVLEKFFKYYSTMKTSSRFMEIYSKKFVLRGKTVKIISDSKKRNCKVLGVDNKSGALIVETSRGAVEHIISPKSVIMPKRVRFPGKRNKNTER